MAGPSFGKDGVSTSGAAAWRSFRSGRRLHGVGPPSRPTRPRSLPRRSAVGTTAGGTCCSAFPRTGAASQALSPSRPPSARWWPLPGAEISASTAPSPWTAWPSSPTRVAARRGRRRQFSATGQPRSTAPRRRLRGRRPGRHARGRIPARGRGPPLRRVRVRRGVRRPRPRRSPDRGGDCRRRLPDPDVAGAEQSASRPRPTVPSRPFPADLGTGLGIRRPPVAKVDPGDRRRPPSAGERFGRGRARPGLVTPATTAAPPPGLGARAPDKCPFLVPYGPAGTLPTAIVPPCTQRYQCWRGRYAAASGFARRSRQLRHSAVSIPAAAASSSEMRSRRSGNQ